MDLLSIDEAANELKVSIHTIRSWGYQGRFPLVKLGRRVLIDRETLENFVKKNIVPSKDNR